MSLALDDRKLLPLGVHDASLEEVEEFFGGFQKSDRRIKLFKADESGSNDERKWTAFFQQVNVKWCRQFGWPVDSTKGLPRVTL
jgi:hypothetical protein